MDICSTGLTTITTTITSTVCPVCTAASTGVPSGWYTTVTVCNVCGPAPTTVTLTKPVEYKPTEAVAYVAEETAAAYVPTSSKPHGKHMHQHVSHVHKTHYHTKFITVPAASSSSSYVTKVVTVAVSPIPYEAVGESASEYAASTVEATGGYVAPTSAATGGYVAPTGTWSASGGVPYASTTALPFEGAASKRSVGMGMVAVVVAAVFAL